MRIPNGLDKLGYLSVDPIRIERQSYNRL